MAQTNAMCSVTIPGTLIDARDSQLLKSVCSLLDFYGIEYKWVDTIPGWWSLDQDWLEFKTEIETGWDCVLPTLMQDKDREWLYNCLVGGNLVMIVHYLDDDGKVVKPHS